MNILMLQLPRLRGLIIGKGDKVNKLFLLVVLLLVSCSVGQHVSNINCALTFDDGPHVSHTPKIVQTLKKHSVKATFFILGEKTAKNTALLSVMVKDGHELAGHGWDHRLLTKETLTEIKNQINQSKKIIKKITGKNPKFYRPAYGGLNASVRKIIKDADMKLALWTYDSRDWKKMSHTMLKNNTAKKAGPGDILLFHDIQPKTVKALDGIIKALKKKGCRFGTLSEFATNPKNKFSAK